NDNAGTGGGPPAGDAVQAYVAAVCSLARTCCGRASYPAAPLANCETEFVAQVDPLQEARMGTVVVDEQKLAACTRGLQALAASCSYDAQTGDGCSDFLNGTRAEGQPCDRADECVHGQSPVACIKVSTAGSANPATGVCRTLTRGQAGSPCLESG